MMKLDLNSSLLLTESKFGDKYESGGQSPHFPPLAADIDQHCRLRLVQCMYKASTMQNITASLSTDLDP